MPLIQVSVNQNKIETNPRRIEKAAKRILNALGYTEAELSITIVDDEEMRNLNLEYRGVDSTTDVLSFPMLEGECGDVCEEMLGDVVLSAPTALEMSKQHGCPLASVLDLLLVHGILHLLGKDHGEADEARRMEAETLSLLEGLGHDPRDFGWYALQS